MLFESRGRCENESRTGNGFGKDPDIETSLLRTRLGLSVKPVEWLKVSGMVQDSRAPFYGANAPNTVRMRIPMMPISCSDLMSIRSERSDAGLSQCEIVIDIRQDFGLFSPT